MSDSLPFGGGIFIADTSAWDRVHRLQGRGRAEWEKALDLGQIAACPPITLELLYGTQRPPEFDDWADALLSLRRVALIDRDAYGATVEGYRELAHRGAHRGVPFADLLAAGGATARRWGILHYDQHFDLLSSLNAFDFESRWLFPRGSVP